MAATLQRKCSGGINFVIITKIITNIIVSGNYFVIISARMVCCPLAEWTERRDFFATAIAIF